MERYRKLIGFSLREIKKKDSNIILFFNNAETYQKYKLAFEGLLFETYSSAINMKVENIKLTHNVGFKATTQLRHLGENPDNYKQLLIQMKGSTNEYKIELICAFKEDKLVKTY